jgi:hypothetical protein
MTKLLCKRETLVVWQTRVEWMTDTDAIIMVTCVTWNSWCHSQMLEGETSVVEGALPVRTHGLSRRLTTHAGSRLVAYASVIGRSRQSCPIRHLGYGEAHGRRDKYAIGQEEWVRGEFVEMGNQRAG